MKKIHLLMLSGAVALFVVGTAASAATPAENRAGDAARVESAGTDGGLPSHVAEVPSADYAQAAANHAPKTPTPLAMVAVFGAALAAIGFFALRSRRSAPPAG